MDSSNPQYDASSEASDCESMAPEFIDNDSQSSESVSSQNTHQKLLLELNELKDKYLRAQAEVENVRRRAQEEVTKARLFGLEKLAKALLPVHDSLEMAVGLEGQTLDSLKQGLDVCSRQMLKLLEEVGITEMDPLHQPFDPNHHQAMTMEESSDVSPNHVVRVLQKGALLHQRVLRPALVVVSKASTK